MIRAVVIIVGLVLLGLGCEKANFFTVPSACTLEGRCEFIPNVQEQCDCAGVDLRFLSLDDSRCPEGAVCVWGGVVAVQFLANGQDTVGFTGSGDLSNANIRVDTLGDLALRLVGLFPYPQVDEALDPEEYFIVVQWEEL